MSDIKQFADIQISISNPRITRAGFGVPLVLGINEAYPERARIYSDIEGVGADYDTTTEEYIAANMLFSQELSPSAIVIGRRLALSAQSSDVTIAGTILENESFTATVGRTPYTYVALTTPSPTTVATGLAALIDTDPLVSATASTGVITIVSETTGDSFTVEVETDSVGGSMTTAANTGTVEAIADALDAINLVTKDYYGLVHTKRGSEADMIQDITDLSAAALSRTKLAGWSTNQAAAKAGTPGNIGETLRLLSNNLTLGIWSENHMLYPEAGWFGGQLPKAAGSTNWKFKPIVGALPDVLTASELVALKANNFNFTEEVNGRVFVTSEAQTCGGEYVDIIRGVHATEAEMQENCLALFLSTEVIRFTQSGMQSLASQIEGVLYSKAAAPINLYVANTIDVVVPKVEDIPASEKGNRQFKGTTFSAQLQGAINFVEMRGRVYP